MAPDYRPGGDSLACVIADSSRVLTITVAEFQHGGENLAASHTSLCKDGFPPHGGNVCCDPPGLRSASVAGDIGLAGVVSH